MGDEAENRHFKLSCDAGGISLQTVFGETDTLSLAKHFDLWGGSGVSEFFFFFQYQFNKNLM